MNRQKPIRVLMAKAGLDAHQRGALIISMGLKDQGMEVIYTGLRQPPEVVLQTAIQEDVDVIGVSSLAGGHNTFMSKLFQKAKEKGIDLSDILVLVGGIIPNHDIDVLKDMGVSATFGPGTPIHKISEYIKNNIKARNSLTESK
ncbi:MAG: cobalamin B12-binding domain-containing protein [Deltaproteobacteria bacterium]|nr:cobalamin B12-binding domain-containing protein [Deltaproteobacteria bacterium]